MTRSTSIAATIFLAMAAHAGMCSQQTNAPKYSRSEIRQMIRTAHTAPQYQDIAAYYRSQQQSFEQQAQSEKVEWDRRSLNVTGPAAKYPRPVDSSKNRYEYFTYEAQQMAQQAEHFEGLAAKAQP